MSFRLRQRDWRVGASALRATTERDRKDGRERDRMSATLGRRAAHEARTGFQPDLDCAYTLPLKLRESPSLVSGCHFSRMRLWPLH